MRILLVGGAKLGEDFLKHILNADFDAVYAVDGGARHLMQIGLCPTVLLGDFDSLNPEEVEAHRQQGVAIYTFPIEKDWTDMELAIDLAIKEGATSITVVGGTGERLDHTLANISLLYRAETAGVEAILQDHSQMIRLIPPGVTIELQRRNGKEFSLFPLNQEVHGVRAWGVKYPLEDGVLRFGETLGVHNEISARTAHVVGGDAYLVLVQFKMVDAK